MKPIMVTTVMALAVIFWTPSVSADLTPDQVKQAQALIAQFTSPEFAVRQKAVEELIKMGPAVLPLVQKALAETKDDEVKLRCEMVVKGLTPEQDALAVILLKGDVTDPNRLNIPAEDERLKAITELTAIRSPEAVGILRDFLIREEAGRKLKQQALCALGKIGSNEAVGAIEAFEKWAQARFASPWDFRFGTIDVAIDHFSPLKLDPAARYVTPAGKEWAVFKWHRFGQDNFWITQKLADDKWSPPIMLNLAVLPIQVQDPETDFRLKEHLADSDQDGITDETERLFGTDPKDPDTDKDSIPDGKDSNPLTPKLNAVNDETEIRQAVFSVLFATCNSRDAIVMVPKVWGRDTNKPAVEEKTPAAPTFADQEYYGYPGYVLRTKDVRPGFVNVTQIEVKIEGPDSATADISDWEGSEAASTHHAKLKKVARKWAVVEFRLGKIS